MTVYHKKMTFYFFTFLFCRDRFLTVSCTSIWAYFCLKKDENVLHAHEELFYTTSYKKLLRLLENELEPHHGIFMLYFLSFLRQIFSVIFDKKNLCWHTPSVKYTCYFCIWFVRTRTPCYGDDFYASGTLYLLRMSTHDHKTHTGIHFTLIYVTF
jgi:hypothetical protein